MSTVIPRQICRGLIEARHWTGKSLTRVRAQFPGRSAGASLKQDSFQSSIERFLEFPGLIEAQPFHVDVRRSAANSPADLPGLIGTDSPYLSWDVATKSKQRILRSSESTDSERQAILAGNASRLFPPRLPFERGNLKKQKRPNNLKDPSSGVPCRLYIRFRGIFGRSGRVAID
jgi:hypothetical protein